MVEVLRKLDVPSVEQVIAVPMISLDRVPQRSAVRRPQKAEQLVEVPTEPGYSLTVIAVQALGRRAAVALAEQIVDIPVPQVRRGGGGLQGSRAGQGSTAVDVEQIVEIPARNRGLQGFRPGHGSTVSPKEIQWVFRTSPRSKKSAEVFRQSSPSVPTSVSSSEWPLPGSLMSQERMRLVTACPLLVRPYSGCGGGGWVGERAEAEAAEGGAVQKSVGIPVMDVPALFSDKFLQSKEFDLIVPQLQFIFRVCIPVVQRRRVRTTQPVQKTGDSTVLVQFWRAVDKPVVVQRQAPGCSQCGRLWSTTAAVLWWLGRRLGGRKSVCSCFQTWSRSSSHR